MFESFFVCKVCDLTRYEGQQALQSLQNYINAVRVLNKSSGKPLPGVLIGNKTDLEYKKYLQTFFVRKLKKCFARIFIL